MDSRRSFFDDIFYFFNPEAEQKQKAFQEFQQSFENTINQKYKDSYISASIIGMNDGVINSYLEKETKPVNPKTIFGVYICYSNTQTINLNKVISNNDLATFLRSNGYTTNDPNYQTYLTAVTEFKQITKKDPYEDLNEDEEIGAKTHLFIFSEDDARLAIEGLMNAPSLQFSKT